MKEAKTGAELVGEIDVTSDEVTSVIIELETPSVVESKHSGTVKTQSSSATLGSLLKELAPHWKMKVFEKLASAGEESSNEWNNAGTGHAALCELNYTSEKPDGSVDISKAINVNEQFQISRQFWAYLVQSNVIRNPKDFIMPIPHISLVHGADNVQFLKKRMEALSNNTLFHFCKNIKSTTPFVDFFSCHFKFGRGICGKL